MNKQEKNKLIRLAHRKPELREKILGLIQKQAAFKFIQDGELDGLSFEKIQTLAERKFGQAFDQVDIASIRKVNGKIRITASVRVDIGAGSNEVAEVAQEYGIGVLAPDNSGTTAPELTTTDSSVDMTEVQDTPFPTRETVRNVVVVDNRTPASSSSSSSAFVSIPLPSRTRTQFRSRARSLPFVSVTRGTRHQSPTHNNAMVDGVGVNITVEGNTPEERAADAYKKFLELKREFPEASLVTDFYIQGNTLFIIIADAQVPEDTSAIADARSSYETYESMSSGSGGSFGGGSSYSDDDYEEYDDEDYADDDYEYSEEDSDDGVGGFSQNFDRPSGGSSSSPSSSPSSMTRQPDSLNVGVPPQAQQTQSPAPAKGDYVMLDGSAIPNSVFVAGYLEGIKLARRDRAVQERYGFDRNGNPISPNEIYKWNFDTARGWMRRMEREPSYEMSKAQVTSMNSTLGYKKPKSQRSGIASPHILKGVWNAISSYPNVDTRSLPSKSWFMKNFGFAEGFQGQNSTEANAHQALKAARSSRRASDETRAKLIRLAYQKPELRSKILPLLEKTAAKPVQVGDYFEDGDGSFYKVLEIKGKSTVTLRRTRGKTVDTKGQTRVIVPDDSGFIGKPYVGRIDGQGMVKAPFGGRKLFRWDGKPSETIDSQFK